MKLFYILLCACSFLHAMRMQHQYPPLIQAARTNDENAILRYLGFTQRQDIPRSPILEKDSEGRTAHMHAIMLGNKEALDALIAQTCYRDYIYMLDNSYNSPLHYAVMHNNSHAVRLLLGIVMQDPELRFIFWGKNECDKTPFDIAQDTGNTTILALLEHARLTILNA